MIDLSEKLWRLLEDGFFWLTVAFDFGLVWSLLFTLLYAAALGLAGLGLLSRNPAPRAWGLPLLPALALAAAVSFPGESAARVLRSWTSPLLAKVGIEQLPLIMALIWLAGALLGLTRLALTGWKLGTGLAALRPAADDPALGEALKAMNFRRPVIVKRSCPGLPAASWGVFRAVIIVPEDFAGRYDKRERLGVYLHELAHLRSRDSLQCVLMSVLGHLMWFNPLAARFIERHRCHLEIARDREVARLGLVGAWEYARLIAKHAGAPGGLLTGVSGDYKSILRRFSYIFNDPALRPARRDRLAAGACLAAILILGAGGGSAGLQPPAAESRAEFAAQAAAGYPPSWEFEVAFFWRGALGTYSQVLVNPR